MSQSYPNIEVIVVCDGEDGDLRAIAQAFEGDILVRWVFHPENRGLPAARNTGAREAEGEIVLFLDDDVSADSELVAVHMHHHITADQSRKVAVCGITAEGRNTQFSSYVNESLHEAWNLSLETLAATLAATEADSIGEETERNMWFGLNCSIRRNLFLVNGGFNEYFRASDEEMEMGLRLHLAGVEFIFEPRLLLTHKNSKDLTGYFRRCWGTSGKVDVYRVFDLGQRNEQTKRLASIYHGYLLDRLTARCCWHTSRTLQTVAKGLEKAANRTGSRLLVGAWARTSQAGEYWSHAKDAGCTLERLKSVIGPSKCALMLHSVCEPLSKEEASYYIAPRRFHRLMRWFRATGYKTATTAQWLQNDVPEKHVLLSFDDGYDDLYDELLPLVIEHHYTPVIYLVVDRIGASNVWDQKNGLRTRNLLTLEQIREMQKYGVEFGSHTLTHPWLPSLSDAELRREVSDSKHRLEDILGVEITSFAYPTGGVDRRVRSAVADAGYKLAFTINFGLNWWNDPLCQRRVEINDYTSVLDFAFKLRTGYSFGLSVAKRLKDLEQKLPTKVLRNTAGGLRSVGRRVFRKFSPGE
jgi:peptidoglycan/xylan/chitin deacetylase (PgdA/CDA1 family)/glycosyltransferase involved in cell wall biosynthesis